MASFCYKRSDRALQPSLSFITQSGLRQVQSLFQTEFSMESKLVRPLSISSIVAFP
jgi:hypothetical protein